MSTSCSSRPPELALRRVESFRYPFIAGLGASQTSDGPDAPETRAARELAMQQELAAAVEGARAEGVREGQGRAEAAAQEALREAREGIAAALQGFAAERTDYFRRVEGEVVRLALAIARKVLHREVQMDPMLLSGIVRVALDQMRDHSHVVLKAPPACVEQWRGFCAPASGGREQVEVVAEESLPAHALILEAEVGATQINLDSQLQEIESGFFDLLHQRPERSGE